MNMNHCCFALTITALLMHALPAQAGESARPKTHYDESRVPAYVLPKVLQLEDGTMVENARTWKRRRREIVETFAEQMFGRMPGPPENLAFETIATHKVLSGKGVRKQIVIHCTQAEKELNLHLLLYLPAKARTSSPVFLGLNFKGNHSIVADPRIRLSDQWMRSGQHVKDHRALESARGQSASRWPIPTIIGRGYGLATMYYGDIDPDYDDGFGNGVHALFDSDRGKDAWASISAWAWGLRRAVDCLEKQNGVDAHRIAVLGHSRLGKTSLWAGAIDERFALVVSNGSGCGGAALSKRGFGETVARINHSFPHWFCTNFKAYNNNEAALPFDQHMLIAASAPRPVLVCSAKGDRWADPLGEFLAARAASPAYQIHGLEGITETAQPGPGQLVGGSVGYHLREGKHDLSQTDWDVILTFADRHLN